MVPLLNRRQFLATTLAAALARFSLDSTAADDYRALICVFLFGGNDGNNMVVPMDSAYSAYKTARGGLALGGTDLVSLSPPSNLPQRQFSLHSQLSPLAPLWEAGKLALVANTGTLVRPIGKADYGTTANRPANLYSHADQQQAWQSAVATQAAATGWGGRADEQLGDGNGLGLISLGGSTLFGIGQQTSALVLPPSGSFGLNGLGNGIKAPSRAQINSILAEERNLVLVDGVARHLEQGIAHSSLLQPILASKQNTSSAAFTGLTSSIATQLLAVAKLIEARQSLGPRRQIFFVSQGGYDTHNNQLAVQGGLFKDLGLALAAFQTAMDALGAGPQVTSFTMSDFARTLKPASGGGTDHAWGNHHLVLGGAVAGKQLFGQFPTLTLGGPDDADGAGRWIPTLAVEQYLSPLLSWMGLSGSSLDQVLPNRQAFDPAPGIIKV